MAEYDFIAGPRKGKVWKEKYYLRNKKNFIQEAKKYIPINSQWLTKEEFKNYILSLLDKGIPQIYVLEELPEELFPYALIFVQNEGKTSIYVDKEGIRTEINIGDGNYDAVNVVENLPQDLQNNVIYYSENQIDEQKLLEKGLNLDEQKSYIYVYEDEELKQVIPNVDYIAEEEMVFKNKTIKGEDNTIQNLVPEESVKPGYIINKIEASKQYYGYISIDEPKEIVFLDTDGDYITSYVYKATLENNIITEITSISDEKVYYDGDIFTYEGKDYERYSTVDQVFPILDKSIAYSQAIKTYVDNKTQPITDITTKSLKNVYNTTLTTDKIVATDNNGYLEASSLTVNDVNNVVSNVPNKSLKNIYNTTLTGYRVVSTDANGCLQASSLNINDAITIVSNIANKCLKNIYNKTLTPSKIVSINSTGYLEASYLVVSEVYDVVYNVSYKCLKNIYNTTLTANQNVVTDSSGYLTTEAKPHLYAHHYYYDHGGMGEVNFVIYHTSSSQISNNALGDFLYNLGCNAYWKSYPANGQAQYTGGIVQGVYAQLNSGGLTKYTIYVASYTIGANYQEDIGNYLTEHWVKIVKIF